MGREGEDGCIGKGRVPSRRVRMRRDTSFVVVLPSFVLAFSLLGTPGFPQLYVASCSSFSVLLLLFFLSFVFLGIFLCVFCPGGSAHGTTTFVVLSAVLSVSSYVAFSRPMLIMCALQVSSEKCKMIIRPSVSTVTESPWHHV